MACGVAVQRFDHIWDSSVCTLFTHSRILEQLHPQSHLISQSVVSITLQLGVWDSPAAPVTKTWRPSRPRKEESSTGAVDMLGKQGYLGRLLAAYLYILTKCMARSCNSTSSKQCRLCDWWVLRGPRLGSVQFALRHRNESKDLTPIKRIKI
jgi:hypothetical protein